MNTPICDFIDEYLKRNPTRLHMPGHKGKGPLGLEARDITEITGADVLYNADGIIRESMKNASRLFHSQKTLYSTQGATLCIQAMLALLSFQSHGEKVTVAAGRNAHVSFLRAALLCNAEIRWIPTENESHLSCLPTAADIRALFEQEDKPKAV